MDFETRILRRMIEMRIVVILLEHCNLPLADHRCETFWHEQKQFSNSELFFLILHTFCVESAPFDKATFSGQGAVQTPTQLHPRLSSIQPYRRLKVYQLFLTQHLKLFFTLSIHIVNYHPKHQLSLFKVIPSYRAIFPGSCGILICRL